MMYLCLLAYPNLLGKKGYVVVVVVFVFVTSEHLIQTTFFLFQQFAIKNIVERSKTFA